MNDLKNLEIFFEEFGNDDKVKGNVLNKKVFINLLLKHHPDKNPEANKESEIKTKIINAAHESFTKLKSEYASDLAKFLEPYGKTVGGKRRKLKKNTFLYTLEDLKWHKVL